MSQDPSPQAPPPSDIADVPLRERLFPQLSLKFLLKLTAICAAMMWAFRAGAMDNLFWAKCLSVVLMTAMACFFAYAVMFCIAYFLAGVSGAILEPFHQNRPLPPSPGSASLHSQSSIPTKDNA